MKLTSRLILLVLVAILPAIAIQGYNAYQLGKEREAEVRQQAIELALLSASEIDRILDGVRSMLLAVSAANSIRAFDQQRCIPFLAALAPQMPNLATIAAIDAGGIVRCRPDMPDEPIDVSDRFFFRTVMAGADFVVGAYVVGRLVEEAVLPLAVPIRDANGKTVGVAVAALRLDWLTANIRQRGLSPGGSVTVADRNGVIIAREPFPEHFIGTTIPEDFRHLMTEPAPGAIDVVSQDGTRRVLGYVPVAMKPVGLYVSAGLSSEAAFAPTREARRRSVLLLVTGLLLALAAGLVAGRVFIQRPVDKLLEAVAAWQRGDFSARTSLANDLGEFGRIGAEMDRVAGEVERRERALRESEERYRALVHASAAVEWRADAAGGMLESPLWAAYTGQPAAEHVGAGWLDMVHPDDCDAVRAAWDLGHVEGQPVAVEYRVFHKETGDYRWVQESGVALRGADGEIREWVGAVTDIHERRIGEERRRLLVNELNHRVKNSLAIVQAIVAQTLRLSPGPGSPNERIEARLQALSSTHNILNATSWSGAQLRDLLLAELAPYREAARSRVSLDGPPVDLDAKSALALGLIFHELATNAAKYGSLSSPAGDVAVTWSVIEGDGGPVLALNWRERGGPPVRRPQRRGFGSRLVERSVVGELAGELAVDYSAGGFACRIAFPMTWREARQRPAQAPG